MATCLGGALVRDREPEFGGQFSVISLVLLDDVCCSGQASPGRLVRPFPAMDIDLDVPPVSSCLVCGQFGCGGCGERVQAVAPLLSNLIPFERKELRFSKRFFETALNSAQDPAFVFGRALRTGGKKAAFVFGLTAEFFALGSLFLLGVLLFALVFPHIASELFSDLDSWLLLGALHLSSVGFLLFVHWLWGFALDHGSDGLETSPAETAFGERPRPAPKLGIRFGMYSCGWDLITSPAGLALLAFGLPRGTRLRAFADALRVPRIAMRIYLGVALGLSEADAAKAQRRAMRHGSIWIIIGFLMLLAAAVAIGSWLGIGALVQLSR